MFVGEKHALRDFTSRLAEQIELARVTVEAEAASTITPEGTLRAADIDDARRAEYQRRISSLLAGKAAP